MLGEAILVDAYYRSRIERKIVRLMEGDALGCTIDIHSLHRSKTLYDAFAGSVVGVTARLAVIRQHHQAVVLVPVHLTGSVGRVVGHVRLARVGVDHHQLASQLVVFISGFPAIRVCNRRHLVHGIVGISQGNVLTAVLPRASVTFVSSIGTPSWLPMV